ncbi:sensor histidine kinase [Streptomyces hoynatensis]|uniref:histidine kinase n=1 Tax=Streptomyces hoynatensis TaxID=1141874 RepID=A0A3A9Z4J2_9ACTN|nr:histidine kinase [Streptomyces hoynatensis]RKN42247.1 two-component sensor histidine kinase [Streptomyces hoynatensis]
MSYEQGSRVRRWLRDHPLALDTLVAAVVLGVVLCASVTVSGPPGGGSGFGKRHLAAHSWVLTVLTCAVLIARRRYPVAVLAKVTGLSALELILGHGTYPPSERNSSLVIAVVVAQFTVALSTDRRTTVRTGVAAIALLAPTAVVMGTGPWYSSENLGVFAWIALAAALGEAGRSRRAVFEAYKERAERAERTREEEARRRVAEERMRIARELHDVVAHHIALVNVQAGVASHVMDTRPDQAKEALGHIRQTSRRALSELQSTVGLLRHQDEPVAPTEPARGLAVLGELVDGFAQAGMSVTVDAPAAAGPLPSAVDLVAYRVVQEALTNVHKHAGPAATARVCIVRAGLAAAPRLDITVDDDGPCATAGAGGAAADAGGSGHGLTGMRERAAALSGTCEAGPKEGGGFRVRVSLPLLPPGGAEEAEPGGGRERRAGSGPCEGGEAGEGREGREGAAAEPARRPAARCAGQGVGNRRSQGWAGRRGRGESPT